MAGPIKGGTPRQTPAIQQAAPTKIRAEVKQLVAKVSHLAKGRLWKSPAFKVGPTQGAKKVATVAMKKRPK